MSLCPSGKQPFDSRRELKRHLRQKGWRNRIYRCGECGLWHSTRYSAAEMRWAREHT